MQDKRIQDFKLDLEEVLNAFARLQIPENNSRSPSLLIEAGYMPPSMFFATPMDRVSDPMPFEKQPLSEADLVDHEEFKNQSILL